MLRCKDCGSDRKVRNGCPNGKQRYRCKDCGRNYVPGDLRERYSLEKKTKVVRMYLEGMGIRSIERLEGVSNPLIIKWIRRFSKALQNKLDEVVIPRG